MDRMKALTEILPYVREFVGKTFVVKIGGEICSGSYLSGIAEQISLLHHMGIKVVLVHGGGPQMDELLSELGIEPHKVAGRRITDSPTLRAAKMAFNGVLNTDIVAALKTHGALAVGLSGADGSTVIAEKRPPTKVTTDTGDTVTVDYGHVGDIVSVNPALVQSLLSQGMIPVLCSLGIGEDGAIYNINADTIAAELARAVSAAKLVLMTNVPGLLGDRKDPSSLISYTDIDTLKQMIKEGVIKDGMVPKIEACMSAVLRGVSRTHIIDGTRENSLLLELFSNEGCGTMIVDSEEKRQYERAE
ncbi:MAG: acetylglutamate kinase [Pseudomonadota bacterium]